MTLLLVVNKTFAIGTVLAQIFLVVSVVYWLGLRKSYPAPGAIIGKHGLAFAFWITLAASAGSLFYSQIIGFAPCELCWFQRIFMYPLVVVLAVALAKKDRQITDTVLYLAVFGTVISLYHNYIYYFNNGLNVFCVLGGTGVSCVKRYVFEFGYITIPLMALTAFLVIIVLVIYVKIYERRNI